MPLDTRIPLSVENVAFDTTGLVNAVARAQQLQQGRQLHQQQVQLNQQRIQEGDIALQKATQAEKDARISQQASAETPDGDLKKWIKRGTELGWSAEGKMAAEQHADAIFTNELNRKKTGEELTASRNDRSREILAQADQMEARSPEEYRQAYPAMHDALAANDPEYAQHFDRNTPPSAADRNAMKFLYAAKGWTEKEVKAQADAAEEARKKEKEKRDVALGVPLLAEAQAKARDAAFADAARTVEAQVADQSSYDAWVKKQSPEVQGNLPARFDPKNTVASIKRMAMTQAQQATADTAAGNVNEVELYMRANGNDPAKALAARQRDMIARQIARDNTPSQLRLAANDKHVQAVQEYASKFLNDAGGDVDKAKDALQKYVESNAGFSRENRSSIQRAIRLLRETGDDEFSRAIRGAGSQSGTSTGPTGNASKIAGEVKKTAVEKKAEPPPQKAEPPQVPAAAKSVHDSLRRLNVPVSVVDGSDGLPILTKDGKQYKVISVDADGNMKLMPGTWKASK